VSFFLGETQARAETLVGGRARVAAHLEALADVDGVRRGCRRSGLCPIVATGPMKSTSAAAWSSPSPVEVPGVTRWRWLRRALDKGKMWVRIRGIAGFCRKANKGWERLGEKAPCASPCGYCEQNSLSSSSERERESSARAL
jgi:hypothetical protein